MSQPPAYSPDDPLAGRAEGRIGIDKLRPGHFDGLRGFLKVEGAFTGSPNYQYYGAVDVVNPVPGDIIHIIDGEQSSPASKSRLHQRVMLVVRHEQPIRMTPRAMMCIPLCFHARGLESHDDQHWDVQQKPGTPAKAIRVSQARQVLFVRLESNSYLQSGITINLAELWHVEYDHILIDKLGRVSTDSGTKAFKTIGRLFNKSLEASSQKLTRSDGKKATASTHRNPWDGHWERESRPRRHHD